MTRQDKIIITLLKQARWKPHNITIEITNGPLFTVAGYLVLEG